MLRVRAETTGGDFEPPAYSGLFTSVPRPHALHAHDYLPFVSGALYFIL